MLIYERNMLLFSSVQANEAVDEGSLLLHTFNNSSLISVAYDDSRLRMDHIIHTKKLIERGKERSNAQNEQRESLRVDLHKRFQKRRNVYSFIDDIADFNFARNVVAEIKTPAYSSLTVSRSGSFKTEDLNVKNSSTDNNTPTQYISETDLLTNNNYNIANNNTNQNLQRKPSSKFKHKKDIIFDIFTNISESLRTNFSKISKDSKIFYLIDIDNNKMLYGIYHLTINGLKRVFNNSDKRKIIPTFINFKTIKRVYKLSSNLNFEQVVVGQSGNGSIENNTIDMYRLLNNKDAIACSI
jgi:hypothetical protein